MTTSSPISILARPVAENLAAVAAVLGKSVDELSVAIQTPDHPALIVKAIVPESPA